MEVKELMSTIYVVHKGKVLLVFNKTMNNWIALGGHVEPNELPCDAAIREAKEESGLDIVLVQAPGTVASANLIQPRHIHLDHIRPEHQHINLMYFGRVSGGQMRTISDEETELRWFTREDLETAKDMIPNVREWALFALDELV